MGLGIFLAITVFGVLLAGILIGICREQKQIEYDLKIGKFDERQLIERYKSGFICFIMLFIYCFICCGIALIFDFLSKYLVYFISFGLFLSITVFVILLMKKDAIYRPGDKKPGSSIFMVGPMIVIVGQIKFHIRDEGFFSPFVIIGLMLTISFIVITVIHSIYIYQYKKKLEQDNEEQVIQ